MDEGHGHPALFDLLEESSETLQLLLGMARIVSVAVRQVGHESFDAEGFPTWKGSNSAANSDGENPRRPIPVSTLI